MATEDNLYASIEVKKLKGNQVQLGVNIRTDQGWVNIDSVTLHEGNLWRVWGSNGKPGSPWAETDYILTLDGVGG